MTRAPAGSWKQMDVRVEHLLPGSRSQKHASSRAYHPPCDFGSCSRREQTEPIDEEVVPAVRDEACTDRQYRAPRRDDGCD